MKTQTLLSCLNSLSSNFNSPLFHTLLYNACGLLYKDEFTVEELENIIHSKHYGTLKNYVALNLLESYEKYVLSIKG